MAARVAPQTGAQTRDVREDTQLVGALCQRQASGGGLGRSARDARMRHSEEQPGKGWGAPGGGRGWCQGLLARGCRLHAAIRGLVQSVQDCMQVHALPCALPLTHATSSEAAAGLQERASCAAQDSMHAHAYTPRAHL